MRLLILSIVLLMCTTKIIGQQAEDQNSSIIKVGKQYVYDKNAYSLNDLGSVFQGDPMLMDRYNSAMKSHRKGKIFGYTTLGVLGVGVLAVAINPSDAAICDNCWSTGVLIGAASVLIIPVTGSIALLSHFKGKGKLKKLISSFNEKEYDALGRVIEQPRLNLATSGVGISISF